MKISFTINYDTTTKEFEVVNMETGEVKSVNVPKKTKKSSPTSTKPLLTLEDNKYLLNDLAVENLGVEPGSRIDIKYEKCGNKLIPIIGCDEIFGTKGGNKLNKSNSVSCRGKAHDQLAQYGTEFELIPHTTDRLFILQSTSNITEENDDNIVIPSDIPEEDLPMDLNLDDLIEDEDNTEISALDFRI